MLAKNSDKALYLMSRGSLQNPNNVISDAATTNPRSRSPERLLNVQCILCNVYCSMYNVQCKIIIQ